MSFLDDLLDFLDGCSIGKRVFEDFFRVLPSNPGSFTGLSRTKTRSSCSSSTRTERLVSIRGVCACVYAGVWREHRTQASRGEAMRGEEARHGGTTTGDGGGGGGGLLAGTYRSLFAGGLPVPRSLIAIRIAHGSGPPCMHSVPSLCGFLGPQYSADHSAHSNQPSTTRPSRAISRTVSC